MCSPYVFLCLINNSLVVEGPPHLASARAVLIVHGARVNCWRKPEAASVLADFHHACATHPLLLF